MDANFTQKVFVTDSSGNATVVVKIANPEELASALPVEALPDPSEAYRNLFVRVTGTNTVHYLNVAGDGWLQVIAANIGDGEDGDKLVSAGGLWVNTPYLPFGDQTADGAWRIGRSGDDLIVERRESAAWVEKARVQA